MQDRPYQIEMDRNIYDAWNSGHRVVCGVLPTGGGKTHIFSGVLQKDMQHRPVCALAHRKELVGQMSLALARRGVRHNIIGPLELGRFCIQNQIQELGTSFYNPTAACTVVAVKTLLSRYKQHKEWCQNVGTYVLDEGHHALRDNEWGKTIDTFTNARGLLVTATPIRADGKGLGRYADGYVDHLIVGPTMRELINQGYLCDYQIVCPESDIDLHEASIGSTGDYSPQQLKAAARKSHIVGDVVEQYRKWALGKRTIVFATDVETGGDIAHKFKEAGIRAEMVSGNTDATLRNTIIRQFRVGQIDVLVNVDLFGEGFDVPAVECVMFARPTESYGLYCQMFGRALRILPGKLFGLIIDMVGNVRRHNLPDIERVWSINSREKTPRAKRVEDTIEQVICVGCTQPFPAIHTACPYCGTEIMPAGRATLEQVKGDLAFLSPELMAKMREAHRAAMESPESVAARMRKAGLAPAIVGGAYKQKFEKLSGARQLQAVMAWWAKAQVEKGHTEREINKMFYLLFGVDPITAVTASGADCMKLAGRILVAMGAPAELVEAA